MLQRRHTRRLRFSKEYVILGKNAPQENPRRSCPIRRARPRSETINRGIKAAVAARRQHTLEVQGRTGTSVEAAKRGMATSPRSSRGSCRRGTRRVTSQSKAERSYNELRWLTCVLVTYYGVLCGGFYKRSNATIICVMASDRLSLSIHRPTPHRPACIRPPPTFSV